MNQSLITYEDLQSMFKTRTVQELVCVLEGQRIKFLNDRKHRPTTTQNSLDHAMGLPILGISPSVNVSHKTVKAV